MGPNVWICQGQNDEVLAYDINCDGKAEVMLRSSEGTRFWNKSANNFGLYSFKSTVGDIDGDGIIIHLLEPLQLDALTILHHAKP